MNPGVVEPGACSSRRLFRVLGILILLTLLLRLPLLDIPFERDEGGYAYIGWRLGHHELPYRDWVDQKPPAIFWVYRFALSLPFDSIRAVHLVALVFSAAAACALFFLARRFMSLPWAAVAAGLFAVLSTDPLVEGTAANTELFMLLPLILSQIAFHAAASGGRRRIALMLLSGALTGVAMAFKQVAGVNWFFLIVCYPLFVTGKGRWRQTLSFAACSTAGAALVWGFIAVWFWRQNALKEFIYYVFTYNLEYASTTPLPARFGNCAEVLAVLWRTQSGVWILTAVGLGGLWAADRRKLCLFVVIWLITSMAGVSASGYFFAHYFQQLLPALCVAAALGAEAFYGARFWGEVPRWGRGSLLALLLVLPPAMTMFPFLFVYSPSEAVRRIYPGNPFAEMPEMGRRIARMTQPGDRVFMFGMEAEALFYARRVSATRYVNLLPLYNPNRDMREKQAATAREVTLARPAAALYIPNGLFFLPGSEQSFTDWSQSYVDKYFLADSFLILDQMNTDHLVTPADGRGFLLPAGQRVIGVLSLRRNGTSGGAE